MDTNHHSECAPGLPGNPVDRTISPDDGMFNGDEEHYFSAGRSALLNIKRGVAPTRRTPPRPSESLTFPAGTAGSSGTCRTEFPRAEITACDLLRDGVDFAPRPSARLRFTRGEPRTDPAPEGRLRPHLGGVAIHPFQRRSLADLP